jgi:peptidoglycan LD-endopeptidase CwlK
MSRDPKELVPELQEKYAEFCARMDGERLRFILTATRRTPEEQAALYAQGRTKPGKIVTWTLKSKHIEGKAFDIAMLDDKGKINWQGTAYQRPGEIGEEIGLEWGGSWSKPDRPHFQLKED